VKETQLSKYQCARRDFFVRHGARWTGTLADEFDVLAPCLLSRAEAGEILNAAGSLARIYNRAAQLVRRFDDGALSVLGVPPHLLRFVRCAIPGMADCVVGRFDLARTEEGYKLLEFNADVPGLIVEAFSVNTEVCRDAGKRNPNDESEQILIRALSGAVVAGLEYTGKNSHEETNVVVTSVGRYLRDRAVAEYLCRLMESFSAQFAPIETLSIDENGLYDPKGKRIDVLYRVFPLQFIRNGIFRGRGMPADPEMGGTMLRLVEQRKLAIINPPFSFLLESKALQAVIWNLANSEACFTSDERKLVTRYMLPTYFDPPSDNSTYVVKPVYGAEGDSVRVIGANGTVISQAGCTTHSGQSMVYQKYVAVPAPKLMTEFGRRRLHVIMSCFLISGTPTGICQRAGESITEESAWVQPTCMKLSAASPSELEGLSAPPHRSV
jgi:glutathionylspermidine synthase